jgi:hypothetical protein
MMTANANLSWLRTLAVADDIIGLLDAGWQQDSMKGVSRRVRLEATQHMPSASILFAKKQVSAAAPHAAWMKRFSGLQWA